MLAACDNPVEPQLITFEPTELSEELPEKYVNAFYDAGYTTMKNPRTNWQEITPNKFKNDFRIYGYLDGVAEIIVYKDKVFQVRMNYEPGLDSFAYYATKYCTRLYYWVSHGSTFVNGILGIFDFRREQNLIVDIERNYVVMNNYMYTFASVMDETTKEFKLQAYELSYSSDNKSYIKGEIVIDNLLEYDLLTYEAFESKRESKRNAVFA